MENIEELKEHVKFVTNLCMPGGGLEELIESSVKDDISARLFLMAVSSIRDAASVREIFSGADKDYENSINKKLADMYTPFDNLNKKINAQANSRICVGKKASFYCMVPIEETEEKIKRITLWLKRQMRQKESLKDL